MSTETAPDTSNAEPTAPAPATSPGSRSAFIDRAAKASPAEAPAPEAEAAPAAEADENVEDKKIAEITARLEQRRRDAEARSLAEEDAARRRSAPPRQERPVDDPFDEIDRDPIAALRRRGKDPKKLLEKLTQDALNPGSVRVENEAAVALEQTRRVTDRLNSWEQRDQQRQIDSDIAAERREFVAELGDATKYPRASSVSESVREEIGVREWEKFAAEEHSAGRRPMYDRELIAVRTERFLKNLNVGTASAKPVEKPKASAKPVKTITPDMAASSGEPRGPIPLHKRREAFIQRANRGR